MHHSPVILFLRRATHEQSPAVHLQGYVCYESSLDPLAHIYTHCEHSLVAEHWEPVHHSPEAVLLGRAHSEHLLVVHHHRYDQSVSQLFVKTYIHTHLSIHWFLCAVYMCTTPRLHTIIIKPTVSLHLLSITKSMCVLELHLLWRIISMPTVSIH